MSTHTPTAEIVSTVVAVVRTDRPVHDVGVCTNTRVAHIVRTFITVVRADRAVGQIVGQANTEPVAGVRVGAIINRWTATGRPR